MLTKKNRTETLNNQRAIILTHSNGHYLNVGCKKCGLRPGAYASSVEFEMFFLNQVYGCDMSIDDLWL